MFEAYYLNLLLRKESERRGVSYNGLSMKEEDKREEELHIESTSHTDERYVQPTLPKEVVCYAATKKGTFREKGSKRSNILSIVWFYEFGTTE